MHNTKTDFEIYTDLQQDLEALKSTLHSRLVRINVEIRRINQQPYIQKQVVCLEKFKDQRREVEKFIGKINSLYVLCSECKAQKTFGLISEHKDAYKELRENYFKMI
jgi:negative regulator of replication initiation